MTHFFKLLSCLGICLAMSSFSAAASEQSNASMTELVVPIEGKAKYPFSKNESISCGQWVKSSQDYPYFGAPRDHDRRRHAGVDVYPEGGSGSSVKALADGIIIKIAPFYTRANGEVTYGVLVDHAEFVGNYAELNKPDIKVMTTVKQGQIIGTISGTKQLHFELYTKGTKDWLRWYGKKPDDLMDPTEMLIRLFNK